MSTPAIFLDRDGVLNVNRPDDVTSWDEFEWLPGSLDAMVQFATLGYPIVVVTNQRAIAHGRLTKRGLADIHRRIEHDVERAGGYVTRFYSCPCAESGRPCPCAKPSPFMLRRARRELDIDLSRSYLVGDKVSDILSGLRAGCTTILVLTGEGCGPVGVQGLGTTEPDSIQRDLAHAAKWILLHMERQHKAKAGMTQKSSHLETRKPSATRQGSTVRQADTPMECDAPHAEAGADATADRRASAARHPRG